MAFDSTKDLRSSRRLGLGGFFRPDRCFFAFDVALPASAVFNFVVLFAHKCLYFDRVLRFCESTMKVLAGRFNIYLALVLLLGVAGGCQTSKADKQTGALRVHIEADPDPAGTSQPISVIRSDPVLVTIKREPILTEVNIVTAKVIDAHGGFAIEIKYDESGTWTLEQYSAANPGRHFAVFGAWGDKMVDSRWLGAPFISHRISDGVLAFTPDCSREEADKLVLGLNNYVKSAHKGMFK